jgi:tetratricopeptide (TPR) repeat protein
MKNESKIINRINFRTLLVFFILLNTVGSIAQKNIIKNIDSLKFQLNKPLTDSTKILILYEIGRKYVSINRDSLVVTIQKISNLSITLKYHKGLALAHMLKGELANRDSDLDKAIREYNLSLEYFISSNEIKYIATIYNLMGIQYSDYSDFTNALINYSKSLEYHILAKNDLGISSEYNNIGIIYKKLGEYDSAYSYYYKTLELSLLLKDKKDISLIYNNIANLNIQLKKYDEAKDFLLKAISINNEIENTRGLGFNYENLGVINFNKGQYKEAEEYYTKAINIYKIFNLQSSISDILKYQGLIKYEQNEQEEAIKFFNKSLSIKTKIGDKLGESQVLFQLAQSLITNNNVHLALTSVKSSLSIAEKIGSKSEAKLASGFLHDLYYKVGKFDQAYSYLEKYNLHSKGLMDQQKINDIGKLESRYILNSAKNENEILQKEKAIQLIQLNQSQLQIKNQNTILIALLICLFFALMAIVFWYLYTVRKRNTIFKLEELNAEINIQKEQIETQADKLKKSHLEVKNMNESLSELVDEKTKKIKSQNIKLRNYALANSQEIETPLNELMKLIKNDSLKKATEKDKSILLAKIKSAAENIDRILFKANDLLKTEKL